MLGSLVVPISLTTCREVSRAALAARTATVLPAPTSPVITGEGVLLDARNHQQVAGDERIGFHALYSATPEQIPW